MPINIEKLQQALSLADCDWINQIDAFDSIESSNDHLLNLAGSAHGRVCLTAHQSHGRGRRSNQWHDNKGQSLLFSLGWSPANSIASSSLNALSLVIGVAIMDALKPYNIQGLGLKWPNDILINQTKLGGVLIDSKIQGKQINTIIGVGLNLSNNSNDMNAVDSPWANLSQYSQQMIDRNALLANCLIAISQRLAVFEQQGFAAIRDDWLAYHALDGMQVRYVQQKLSKQGYISGISDSGALRLTQNNQTIELHAGEIHHIRPADIAPAI